MATNSSINRLRELQGSGYEIADGQPNIIGWTIKDNFNFRVGVVDDLLFDEEQQKVRYIIANLKNNEFDLDKRKVLIPIGNAELHETDDDVILPAVSPWQLRALPTYSQRMTDYDERDIYTVFSAGSGTTLQKPDKTWQKPQNFYEHPTYNEDNLYRHRMKPGQTNTPVERTFRKREGSNLTTNDYTERSGINEQSRMGQQVYERDAELVSNDTTSRSGTENMRQNISSDNDEGGSVLSRIRKMHQELNELERDLRANRDVR